MSNTVASRDTDLYQFTTINQAVASGNSTPNRLEFRLRDDPVADRTFDLIILTRSPKPNTRLPKAEIPADDELSKIVARTVMNWANVMRAVIFDIPLPEERYAGIDSIRRDVEPGGIIGIPENDAEPYCTVYNAVNYYKPGLSVSVHSWDDGTWALATALQHIQAVNMVKQHGHKFGLISIEMAQQSRIGQHADTQPDTKTATPPVDNTPPATKQSQFGVQNGKLSTGQNTPPPPAQQPPAANNGQLNLMPRLDGKTAWIRECRKDEFAPTMLRVEGGQKAKPNFNTAAVLATKPYNRDKSALDYPHGTLVAYEIHGKLTAGEYDGSLYVDIPLADNKQFRVFYSPEQENGEWKILRDRLAIDWENLQPGMVYGGNVDYLVVKYNQAKDNANILYRNLSGLYNMGNS